MLQMDHSERLEVNEDAMQQRLESQLRVIGSGSGPISGPPSIGPIGRCKILDSVKQFLLEMAKAEQDLNLRLQSGENLDIENCSGEKILKCQLKARLHWRFCSAFSSDIFAKGINYI